VLENCGSVGGRVFDTRGHCDKKITVVKFGVAMVVVVLESR